jgi:hypothetical protein
MTKNASELRPTGHASACNLNPGKAIFPRRSGPIWWHSCPARADSVAFLTSDCSTLAGFYCCNNCETHCPGGPAILATVVGKIPARMLQFSGKNATECLLEGCHIINIFDVRMCQECDGAKNGRRFCCRVAYLPPFSVVVGPGVSSGNLATGLIPK